jgi:hypothetical protein
VNCFTTPMIFITKRFVWIGFSSPQLVPRIVDDTGYDVLKDLMVFFLVYLLIIERYNYT